MTPSGLMKELDAFFFIHVHLNPTTTTLTQEFSTASVSPRISFNWSCYSEVAPKKKKRL